MIKLTLTPKTQPITYVFEKNCVTIGKLSPSETPPDLALPCEKMKSLHIKIDYVDNRFIAFNLAEDPFTTLDDLPFNKKSIYSGNVLRIYGIDLEFEGAYREIDNEIDAPTEQLADLPPENLIEEAVEEDFEIDHAMNELEEGWAELPKNLHPADASLPSKASRPLFPDDELEALLSQVAELDKQEENRIEIGIPEESKPSGITSIEESAPEKIPFENVNETLSEAIAPLLHQASEPEKQPETSPGKNIEPPSPVQPRRSMKDDASGEEDASKKKPGHSESSANFNTKTLIAAITAFILLIAFVFACFYFVVTGHNEEKEIKAAQAVADVAMALNFAQINHAKAQNQNWSKPEFLNENIASVLAPPYAPLAEVNAQGKLLSTSYILRIYTGSDDLNHFLIIAQPDSGFLQWLVPKAAITVDSGLMELRKITDLKTLNRLLVNATLDTSNSADIANFVRLGELVPLTELKKYHPHTGFDIPQELSQKHPGAENLIYNGARYYPLGEALVRKAIAMYENGDTPDNVPSFVDEINRFTRFPNLVLYSSGGIHIAERGQKALNTFFPQHKFLHAYLQFNSQNFATTGQLLTLDESIAEAKMKEKTAEIAQEEESQEQAPAPNVVIPDQIAMSEGKYQLEVATLDESTLINEFYLEEIDRLASSLSAKEKAMPLKPPSSRIAEKEIDRYHPLYYKLKTLAHTREKTLKVINDEIEREWGNSYKIAKLREAYSQAVDEQQKKIVKEISFLQKLYSTMPLSEFMTYVKAAGVRPFIQENLRRQLDDANHAPFSEESMNISIEKIRRSANLQDLEKNLQETSRLLNLDNFPDPALFINYQNEIHSTVLHKLDTFLLSGSSSQTTFRPEDRATVLYILKGAWVTDQEEINDYLKEFDLLAPVGTSSLNPT